MGEEFAAFSLSSEVREKMRDEEWIKREISKGRTPQDLLNFTPESMAEFYTAARRLFEAKRYLEASKAYLFLVTLNSYVHDYWLGLGMSLQMCQEYEGAIDAYEMAATCEIENPVPYFYLSKCLFAVNDKGAALDALALAIEYSDDIEEYQELKIKALEAKALLIKRQQ